MKKRFALSCFALLMASACNDDIPWNYCHEGSGRYCLGDQLVSCNNGKQTVEDCAASGNICDPKALACAAFVGCTSSDNGCSQGVLQTCDPDTHKLSTVQCPSGVCNADGTGCGDACKFGDTKCGKKNNLDVVISCTADGSWTNEADDNWEQCPQDKHCVVTGGIASCELNSVCTAGQQRCRDENGNAIIDVCSAAGQWNPDHACPSDKPYCDAQGEDCAAGRSCTGQNGTVADGSYDCATEGQALRKCVNGTFVPDRSCEGEKVCSYFNDVADCYDLAAASNVGEACKCIVNEQGVCYWSFTGSEMKQMLASNTHLAALRDAVSDDADLHVPDYFPADTAIEGCTELRKNIPQGMVLGCLRNDKLNLTTFVGVDALYGVIDDVFMGYMQAIPDNAQAKEKCPDLASACDESAADYSKDTCDAAIKSCIQTNFGIDVDKMVKLGKDLVGAFYTDLSFASSNGYCTVGAVDFKLDASGIIGERVFNSERMVELFQMPNVGDHAVAKDVACPAGSTRISYAVNTGTARFISMIGSDTQLAFDVCLRDCNSDADCTSSGTKCVEMAKTLASASGDTVDTAKVCFDRDMYAMGQNLLKKLQEFENSNASAQESANAQQNP